ncbi:SH3 domain-containing protein [Mesobacterium sp. TK19101]|uniref:SH3 domain-containing protein n=1 Tax=Mesobacterium hydrothermale TaxID=3111907 RepID=A0ABU6HHB6_9RHOB|nr:SH3 domain-containing protein [Mesobacterium sp. TK19101]MEC3861492.1 SH3 domain-containing protein [Mesobacterium sp. TK19101]
MTRFILLTFGFLGWTWYEMSGGSEFEPKSAEVAEVQTEELQSVSRASSTLDLTSVAVVERVAAPAPEKVAAVVVSEPAPVSADTAAAPASQPVVADAVPVVVPEPVVAIAEPEPVTAPAPLYLDFREITGNRVNMRNGPGTNYAVLARLSRGDEVVVLDDSGDGWLKLRVVGDNRVGWIADFLVTASN